MKKMKTPSPQCDQNATNNRIYQQTSDALDTLVAAGAQFYCYCWHQMMYLQGQVVDLFSKKDVLAALKQHLNNFDPVHARETAAHLRGLAVPLLQIIPEGTLGTINGVREPKLRMTMSPPRKSVRRWLKEAIESGKV